MNLPKFKSLLSLIILLTLLFSFLILYNIRENTIKLSLYPYGKNYAFTITDDPDGNTLDKISPVYNYFRKSRLKTTAAVWVFRPERTNGQPDLSLLEHPEKKESWPRDTCERLEYLAYMQQLKSEGFEIALHGASSGNDLREVTNRGYEQFRDYFGGYPKINIMHKQNLENVYWGNKVVSNKILQSVLGFLTNRAKIPFSGEIPSSEYFWGDILKSKTKYVRLFGTSDINTLKFNPSMPYYDPGKPYINYWFSFSDGSTPELFSQLLSEENISRLAKERGACIIYTHFANGFAKDGKLHHSFKESIDRLIAEPGGWFVTCSKLLDRLLLMKRVFLTKSEKALMVYNLNEEPVNGITLLVYPNDEYFDFDGNIYRANKEGEIIIDSLNSYQGIVLSRNKDYLHEINNSEIKLKFIEFKEAIYIKNSELSSIIDLRTACDKIQKIYDLSGAEYNLNKKKEIVINQFLITKSIVLLKNDKHLKQQTKGLYLIEELNLIYRRALLYLKHNKYH